MVGHFNVTSGLNFQSLEFCTQHLNPQRFKCSEVRLRVCRCFEGLKWLHSYAQTVREDKSFCTSSHWKWRQRILRSAGNYVSVDTAQHPRWLGIFSKDASRHTDFCSYITDNTWSLQYKDQRVHTDYDNKSCSFKKYIKSLIKSVDKLNSFKCWGTWCRQLTLSLLEFKQSPS